MFISHIENILFSPLFIAVYINEQNFLLKVYLNFGRLS